MKLDRIEIYLLTPELRVPFTTSFGTYTTLARAFVVLTDEDGRRGVGEIPTLTDPAYKAEADTPSVLTSLREFIVPSVAKAHAASGGFASVDDLRESYAWIKGAVFAKSGLEAAYWDLAAQAAHQPLWQLWGGSARTFPVGVSIGGKSADQVVGLAADAAAAGYQRLKVKIWPGFDFEVVKAVRERLPDMLLQVDANSAYTTANWESLRSLDDFNLLLIEQPLYDDDVVLHAEISAAIQTPICLDESIHSLRDTDVAIRLWDQLSSRDRLIINIKPPRVSGFQEAIAIAKHCRAAGVRTWIGGMLDTAWGKAFNLNFNGLAEIDLPGDHFSPTGAYFKRDLVSAPLQAINGEFTLGLGVATGVELDWESFDRLGDRWLGEKLAASADRV